MKIFESIKNLFGVNAKLERENQFIRNPNNPGIKIKPIEKPNPFINFDFELVATLSNGDLEKVKTLLEKKGCIHPFNDVVLVWFAMKGNTEMFKLFLEKGANVHASVDKSLRDAAFMGRTEIVKLALEYGANIHAMDDEALREAATNGHTEIVKLMVVDYNAHVSNETKAYIKKHSQEAFEIIDKIELNKKLSQNLKEKQGKKKVVKI